MTHPTQPSPIRDLEAIVNFPQSRIVRVGVQFLSLGLGSGTKLRHGRSYPERLWLVAGVRLPNPGSLSFLMRFTADWLLSVHCRVFLVKEQKDW
jgi:hypothetical protein